LDDSTRVRTGHWKDRQPLGRVGPFSDLSILSDGGGIGGGAGSFGETGDGTGFAGGGRDTGLCLGSVFFVWRHRGEIGFRKDLLWEAPLAVMADSSSGVLSWLPGIFYVTVFSASPMGDDSPLRSLALAPFRAASGAFPASRSRRLDGPRGYQGAAPLWPWHPSRNRT